MAKEANQIIIAHLSGMISKRELKNKMLEMETKYPGIGWGLEADRL